ncbi:MAG: Tex-like N-terminal domain-containing protein, partial [Planctomycetota bacterium]
MQQAPPIDLGRLAQDLQLKRKQVENVVQLLDEGNTVPFITRYRKEQTGNLDEEQIRAVQHRIHQLRQLADRRQTILRTIETQGKLTEDLKTAILSATTAKRLEDLYLPYKPKKQTLATIARDRGLGNLADAIWNRDEAALKLDEVLPGMLDPERQLSTVEDIMTGVQHILAERIAEDAEVRDAARKVLWGGRIVATKSVKESESPGPLFPTPPAEEKENEVHAEFRNYFDYSEPVRQVPPHRVLAINRGEKLGVLKIRIDIPRDRLNEMVVERLPLVDHPHRDFLLRCAADALDRLVLRSLEREVRGELTDNAEHHAVDVFARNLRNLLLQPPVPGRRVLAIDPGYRTGCKYAVLDEIGNLLNQGVFYPHLKRKKKRKAKAGAPANQKVEDHPEEEEAETPDTFAAELIEDHAKSADAPDEAVSESKPAAAGETSSDVSSEDPPILPADALHRSIGPDDMAGDASEEPAPTPLSDLAAANPATEESTSPSETQEAGLTDATAAAPEAPAPAIAPKPPKAPAEPQISKRDRTKKTIAELCRLHGITVIAIGNGTACRETEELVAEVLKEELPEVAYCIVNEAGASVYSASPVGREEFPNYDATLRGTISIGRRLQDPLSELVKIDPQNIGVGLYQHDLNPRLLKETLSEVVESCVNYVGVDLNTASVPLLQYVSGLNQLRAKNIVEFRNANGPFRNRQQLLDVPGIGTGVFTQAAGFLKITGGDQPFDTTWIHPESYPAAQRVLELLGYDSEVLNNRAEMEHLRQKLASLKVEDLSTQLETGIPTIQDILDNFERPGRDPRDDLPKPIFKTGVLRLEDLTEGMLLQGTVLNVVDFGVFIDIGLKDSGLVHISQLA